jgi:hypothetical protein
MSTPSRFSRPVLHLFAATVLMAFVSIAAAGPVGYLQINGKINVQPDGANKPLRMTENDYAVFSNDRIDTIEGSAVLVLNGGGVIGLSEGSSARIQRTGQTGDVTVTLDSGSVVYSIPRDTGELTVDVDGVRFAAVNAPAQPADPNARRGEAAGTLTVDENRQVSALARAGEIRVLRAGEPQRPAGGSNGAAAANATSLAYSNSSSAGGAALSAQSYDTLTSVSEGSAVQVQTSSNGGTAAISLMSGATRQAGLSGAGSGAVSASGASDAGDGKIAVVGSTQGSSWVVIDEGDEQVQSISP